MKQKHSTRTILFGVLCLVVGVVLLVMAFMPSPFTVRALYVVGSILGFVEGIALLNRKHNDTISHVTTAYCRRHPWVTLLILIFTVLLFGHWFLPEDVRWIWPQSVFVSE